MHALIAKSCAKHAPYKAMGTREFLGMHKTDKAPFPLKVSTGSAVMQRALSCFACYEKSARVERKKYSMSQRKGHRSRSQITHCRLLLLLLSKRPYSKCYLCFFLSFFLSRLQIFGETSWRTYGELQSEYEAIGRGLRALGMEPLPIATSKV